MLTGLLIFLSLATADAVWWRFIDLRLRRMRWSLVARIVFGLFMAVQCAYALWLVVAPLVGLSPEARPMCWPVLAYVWHVLVLPFCVIGMVLAWFVRRRRGRSSVAKKIQQNPVPWSSGSPTRRELLGATAAAIPPLIALGLTYKATNGLGEFRVVRKELVVPTLPPDLDGLTIAQVTDLHLGRFMTSDMAAPMADATSALDADLIAFTGDLIDTSAPNVGPGIEFLRRLRARHGLVVIEGNHDVMHGSERFEHGLKEAGLPLLLDESMTLRIAGRTTPVQFLGTTWGELIRGSELHKIGHERRMLFRHYTVKSRDESVRRVASMREPNAFPILLAHHPHSWDAAAKLGLPLTLSGHTHGGQIMLTQHIGGGPLRFRYWSGLYEKPNSRLFISNGLGSWFPLRINAPCEIVHLTLRAAARPA